MWLKEKIDPMKYMDLFPHVGEKNPTITIIPLTMFVVAHACSLNRPQVGTNNVFIFGEKFMLSFAF